VSKHTPGPWGVDDPHLVWAESVGEYVATTRVEGWETLSREQVEANARLIAAAPELLEALKALTVAVTFADPPKEFNGALCHEARVPVGFVDAARAVIAKATEVKP
jgi:hypothetical protein